MSSFKIQPNAVGHGLCAGCRNGTVYRRSNGSIVSHCHVHADTIFVPGDIVQCTDFDDKTAIPYWDLEKIAWQLSTDKSGKVLGFGPPKKED
jgi:hypothetical protein